MHFFLLLAAVARLVPFATGHAAIWHPSMWGFNVTAQTFSYDNRPVTPLQDYTFEQWWFHGHLDYPPNEGDFFELPAGQAATSEIACDKGATSYYASDPGGDIQDGDNVCPGSPMSEYHTTGYDDLKGCALAITYQSDVSQVQPEDFVVFSVNQTCVWTRFTEFQVPARMPSCSDGGCICAFFWIHSPDSGGEQNYMNGFRCNVTGSTSDVALATPQLARRCGADPDNGKADAVPGNCTFGAKQPLYWFQAERNTMFEGTYSPPFYNNLYNFLDGAQEDIFENSYPDGIPTPNANSTILPIVDLHGVVATATPNAPSYALSAVAAATSVVSSSATTTTASSGSVNSGSASTSASAGGATNTLTCSSSNSNGSTQLNRRRFTRRRTSSGLDSVLDIVRPGVGRKAKMHDRNRLWRLF
ncbi:uncharacterized protein LAESUDRAFT_724528 [Laetiporus sulphureus 93-53]|uniref:Lytic polysaccharide monooxygenase n=1 Tax=Laetiporus sulphureus 93-53 TaxID=1314785 RepID=A0A165EQZ2_9APHY|nr:uncharacterized protein LAESUDRAFT_724528 [Laetiporus sulphureus 93-53]KZT07581.1 hypothetical protein LAESUDRAFT_724528 [Laetiporus sulphureus 93-53]